MSKFIKYYDFNETAKTNGIIGRPRKLAWPCIMYRVTLPKIKQDDRHLFNVFELCILKLLACGRYEPKQLAEETCLPPDLIEVILLRLYDREKIDKYYQVLPDTLKDMEEYDSQKESAAAEYQTYVIFSECIGGNILPMLKEANLKNEMMDNNVHYLESLQKPDNMPVPTPTDIITALQTMMRRQKLSGNSYRAPSAGFISIASGYEQCRLCVCMVIQRNGNWRILNPFGKGWSLVLESAYQKFLEQNKKEADEFRKWQESFKNGDSTRDTKDDKRIKELYETPENESNYPELIAALKRNDISKDTDVYSVLEWTLFYALHAVDTKKIIQLIQVDTRENNVNRLASAIAAITRKYNNDNLNPVKDSSHFAEKIHIPLPSNLQSFQNNDVAVMQEVLPLTILVSQDNPRFLFNTVLQEYPDCLSRIIDLKQRRDSKGHGNNRWSEIYGDDDRKFMRKVVTILLPTVRFADSSPAVKLEDDAEIDIQLNARLTLQTVFGVCSFDKMDSTLQENLLQVEIFRQKHTSKTGEEQNFDALPGINYLYAATQCAFHQFLHGDRPESISIKTVQQRAKDVGWTDFPLTLSKVNPEKIQQTLNGKNQTLGACVIVWLMVTDRTLLKQLADKLPFFLSNIDQLLTLRKHGNQSCLMKKSELDNCIEHIYEIINTITEA